MPLLIDPRSGSPRSGSSRRGVIPTLTARWATKVLEAYPGMPRVPEVVLNVSVRLSAAFFDQPQAPVTRGADQPANSSPTDRMIVIDLQRHVPIVITTQITEAISLKLKHFVLGTRQVIVLVAASGPMTPRWPLALSGRRAKRRRPTYLEDPV